MVSLRGKLDKFSATGLTPVKSDLVDAPYVKEFPLVIECKVIQIIEIGLHTEFIGEIMDVKADSSVLNEKNLPDIEKMKPILRNPSEMTYQSRKTHRTSVFNWKSARTIS